LARFACAHSVVLIHFPRQHCILLLFFSVDEIMVRERNPTYRPDPDALVYRILDSVIHANTFVSFLIEGTLQSYRRVAPIRNASRGQGQVYNPNRNFQVALRAALRAHISSAAPDTRCPVFNLPPKDAALAVMVKFHVKRPDYHFFPRLKKEHFLIRNAGTILPRYRATVPSNIYPDLDNFLKCFLDALGKNLIFPDDKQLVRIECYKLFDVLGFCDGHIEVEVSPYNH
jgi:Holliday junction resolvase RusA-like endonuclease